MTKASQNGWGRTYDSRGLRSYAFSTSLSLATLWLHRRGLGRWLPSSALLPTFSATATWSKRCASGQHCSYHHSKIERETSGHNALPWQCRSERESRAPRSVGSQYAHL